MIQKGNTFFYYHLLVMGIRINAHYAYRLHYLQFFSLVVNLVNKVVGIAGPVFPFVLNAPLAYKSLAVYIHVWDGASCINLAKMPTLSQCHGTYKTIQAGYILYSVYAWASVLFLFYDVTFSLILLAMGVHWFSWTSSINISNMGRNNLWM